ncbi:hypothetical protein [Hymenobacter tenuis]
MHVFPLPSGRVKRLFIGVLLLLLLPRFGAADIAIEPPNQPVYFALKNSKKFTQYRFYCDTGDGILHQLTENKVYKVPVVKEVTQTWTLVVYNVQEKTAFKWRQVNRKTYLMQGAYVEPYVRFEITDVSNNKVTYREVELPRGEVPADLKRSKGVVFLLRYPGDNSGSLQLGLLVASATAVTLLLALRQRVRWQVQPPALAANSG